MLIFISMLRIIFLAAVLMSGLAVKAQTDSSFGAVNRWESAFNRQKPINDTNHIHSKWFVTKYAGVSVGFVAFKGGGGSFLSVPLSLQLNRQLTNNLFAFGAVSATPAVFRSSMPYQPMMNKGNNWMQQNNFSAWSDAKIGVMYISNDRTFSISGSVGVGRGTYNGYSPFYSPMYAPVHAPVGGHGVW